MEDRRDSGGHRHGQGYRPGRPWLLPEYLTAVGGTRFFAAGDGEHGTELWKSDGTAAGTVLVKDINPGSVGSNLFNLTVIDKTLSSRPTTGCMARSCGRATGRRRAPSWSRTSTPVASSYPYDQTVVNGTLLLHGRRRDHGRELWKSDGTAAGTALVKDMGGCLSAIRTAPIPAT